MTPDEIKELRALVEKSLIYPREDDPKNFAASMVLRMNVEKYVTKLLDTIDRLQKQNERYRKALEFYAKPLLITLYNDEMMFVESESYEYRRRAIEALKDCEGM